MLKKIKDSILRFTTIMYLFVVICSSKVLAVTTPNEDEVNEIASKGLKIFFGALAGFAIIMGGIEFYGAFTAHRENINQGGYGEAESLVGKKIFAGIMCLIGAVVCFTILAWTLKLFGLD